VGVRKWEGKKELWGGKSAESKRDQGIGGGGLCEVGKKKENMIKTYTSRDKGPARRNAGTQDKKKKEKKDNSF